MLLSQDTGNLQEIYGAFYDTSTVVRDSDPQVQWFVVQMESYQISSVVAESHCDNV